MLHTKRCLAHHLQSICFKATHSFNSSSARICIKLTKMLIDKIFPFFSFFFSFCPSEGKIAIFCTAMLKKHKTRRNKKWNKLHLETQLKFYFYVCLVIFSGTPHIVRNLHPTTPQSTGWMEQSSQQKRKTSLPNLHLGSPSKQTDKREHIAQVQGPRG